MTLTEFSLQWYIVKVKLLQYETIIIIIEPSDIKDLFINIKNYISKGGRGI
jgi:hypothetical protein